LKLKKGLSEEKPSEKIKALKGAISASSEQLQNIVEATNVKHNLYIFFIVYFIRN
jgi:phage-related protein